MKLGASLLVIPLLALASCSSSDMTDAASKDTALTFEIGGTATTASVTYMTDGLSIAQDTSAAVPWSRTETFTKGTLGVNISAQNAGGGDITCKISQGNKVLSENSSSGEYAVVGCAVE